MPCSTSEHIVEKFLQIIKGSPYQFIIANRCVWITWDREAAKEWTLRCFKKIIEPIKIYELDVWLTWYTTVNKFFVSVDLVLLKAVLMLTWKPSGLFKKSTLVITSRLPLQCAARYTTNNRCFYIQLVTIFLLLAYLLLFYKWGFFSYRLRSFNNRNREKFLLWLSWRFSFQIVVFEWFMAQVVPVLVIRDYSQLACYGICQLVKFIWRFDRDMAKKW